MATRKADHERLSALVAVRGNPAEIERWQETAWRRRTNVSAMVRAFLNREARKELGPEDAPTSPASPTRSSASPDTSTARSKPGRGAAKPRRTSK